jgi:endonuclease/exonuclease/phosphatase family metal-dependent hydrolase
MPTPARTTPRTARLALAALLLCVACGDADAPPDGAGATAPDTLRVLAYNIHHGAGNDEVLDLDRIAALIRDLEPDIVALQEVDRVVERTDGVDQAAVLGELTGMTPVFGEFMPYQGGSYGQAVLSAWPVVESWNHRLPDGAEPRSSVSVRVRSPDTGREIVLADIHFYRTEEERLAQALTLDRLLRETAAVAAAAPGGGAGPPAILAGDFNSEPGTAVMDTLAALGWHVVPKDGSPLTFRSDEPVREIDFVMVRPQERFEVLEHRVIVEPVASDHSPIFAVLVVR